jgi:aminoglycoside 3-N-acetyltransferase
MLKAASDILYVRAALKPLASEIKSAGGLLPYLREHISFNELIVPHFYGARPFWRAQTVVSSRPTNSGSLGKIVAKLPGAMLSQHPTHAFAGLGTRVQQALARHNADQACFAPIGELAEHNDFSMLLLGCVDESPGFSTVHVAQNRLGLSQRHLLRLLMRWDTSRDGNCSSVMAPEAPGCSLSFGKFYSHYEADGNFLRGDWSGVSWLFIPSARRALETELRLLRERGRFVDCGRWNCLSCRLRLY